MGPRLGGFALLAGIWSAAVGAAGDDPQAWLERMNASLQRASYEGTFVYLHGSRLESMRIVRSVDERGERERLVSLNGSHREVIRDGGSVTSILPDARSVFAEKGERGVPFPAVLGEAFERLSRHYRFELGEPDRVASRPVRQIVVEPRDQYRYGYRVWLDEETALPLKAELFDERGAALEQVMFVEFTLRDRVPESMLSPSWNSAAQTPQRAAPEPPAGDPGAGQGQGPWEIGSLPAGFELTAQGREEMPGSAAPVGHMMFSDGLATVSVYLERMDGRKGLLGSSRMGAVSAFGRHDGGYQVTVVGEVPPVTVEAIGGAVRYQRAAAE